MGAAKVSNSESSAKEMILKFVREYGLFDAVATQQAFDANKGFATLCTIGNFIAGSIFRTISSIGIPGIWTLQWKRQTIGRVPGS